MIRFNSLLMVTALMCGAALAADPMSGSQAQSLSSDSSPKEVCQGLVDLSKSPQYQSQTGADRWFITGGKSVSQSKQWFKKEFSSAECGSETIAGNHAVVVANIGAQERLLPFIKQGGMWKLDPQGYQALHRMDSRMPAAEEMKKPVEEGSSY